MRALKEKIRDDEWSARFEEYLEERFCPENIRFLQAVERYRDSASDGEVEKAMEQGQEIIEQFLKDDAPQELNLGFSHRSEAMEQLNTCPEGECPSPSAFDDAQVSIILLIMDYYKDFCSQSSSIVPISDAVTEPTMRPKAATHAPSMVVSEEDDDGKPAGCFDAVIGIFSGRGR